MKAMSTKEYLKIKDESPVLKAMLELKEIGIRIDNVIYYIKFSKTDISEYVRLYFRIGDEDKSSHTIRIIYILKSHLTTIEDVFYYILYYLFIDYYSSVLSNLRKKCDRYIYITHILVKYFGLSFVSNKIYDNHFNLPDDTVEFINCSLILAFNDKVNPYYGRREISIKFFNEWYTFSEVCNKVSHKNHIGFFYYLRCKWLFYRLINKKYYSQTVSSDLFHRIAYTMSRHYRVIEIKKDKS